MPRSRGRSTWGSVVMTQRFIGIVTRSVTVPMPSPRLSQLFSTNPLTSPVGSNDNVRAEPAYFESPMWIQLAEPAQGRGGEQVDRRGVVQGPCPEHVVRILSVEVAPARIYVRDVWDVVLVLGSRRIR